MTSRLCPSRPDPPAEDELRNLAAELSDEERHVLLQHGRGAILRYLRDHEGEGNYTAGWRPALVRRRPVRERDGLAALPPPSPRIICARSAIPVTAWSATKSSARAAAGTRATSSRRRRRPASAIDQQRVARLTRWRAAARQARVAERQRGGLVRMRARFGNLRHSSNKRTVNRYFVADQ